jgi:hypothetical protein
LEAETNKYCPGGNDIGAISNLITWVLNFFLSALSPPSLGGRHIGRPRNSDNLMTGEEGVWGGGGAKS